MQGTRGHSSGQFSCDLNSIAMGTRLASTHSFFNSYSRIFFHLISFLERVNEREEGEREKERETTI